MFNDLVLAVPILVVPNEWDDYEAVCGSEVVG